MKWSKGEAFRITGLYLLIIPFLNALNATGYVNPQIQGSFGASSTEFMYMNLIPVFTLIAGLPLALAMAKHFAMRSMMLTIIFFSIVLNTCSAYATSIELFTICRSLLAFFTIFGIVAAIIPIAVRYSGGFNMAILYGIVQFIIQGSSHFYKFLGTQFAQVYDWKASLLLLNINFFLCIILTLVFIDKKEKPPVSPFRFDWRGWLIFLNFMALLLFLTAEGQNRQWFDDREINMAIAGLLIFAGIYLLHAKYTSMPLIDLRVYRYKNVLFGTLFFFFIGLLNNTGSVIMGFMSAILSFSDLYMANTNLYIGIGLIISIPVCTWLLYKRIYLRVAAIAGFFAFTMYHVIMYFRFYPGIAEEDFLLPLIIKGIGIGFLYVISSLYISERVPKPLSTSRMMSGIMARNVIGILLCGSVLSTLITELTVQHKTGISQQITMLNPEVAVKYNNTQKYFLSKGYSTSEASKMANNSLQQEMAQSATLLAYKDIYLIIAVISFLPILLILILGMGKRPMDQINVEPIPI